jgi:RimJ/RimL family protein N-acetyltransferase
MYADTATDRLFLERWDHDVHADPLARMTADPEVAAFVGSGRPLDRDGSDELSQRIAWHWDQYGFGLRMGFEVLALDEIVAFVHPENERSLAVTRRLGMTEEAECPHPSRDHDMKVLRCSTS